MIEQLINNYISEDNEIISNLANISAILFNNIDNINWLGFYLLEDETLHLGPFQGMQAVSKIRVPEGVCGSSVHEKRTIVVEDVHNFCGHIACDIRSQSEIVIPIFNTDGTIYGVLDVDAPVKSRFDKELIKILEDTVKKIQELL